ncbi:MAG: AAA family ATPase [bacterium]|jgi:chromosome partitioning protein
MPVIVMESSKGGVGKTTSALVVGTELARKASVTLIDADPNRPIQVWAKAKKMPANLQVIDNATEDNIVEVIDDAASASSFVVVDLEGTAAKIAVLATMRADLVIIPMQASQLDAHESAKVINVVRQAEMTLRRPIPSRILFTRTNPTIKTRTFAHLAKALTDRGVPVLKSQLHEREAFKAMFSYQRTLEELDPAKVANLDKAIANAQQIVAEIIAILRTTAATQQQEARA